MNLEDLDTPNVVINEAIVEQNIQRVQSFFDGLGIAFRPHIKTHKSIEIAKKQLKAGAKGINCQKLSEAEVFAKAGFKDILLSYNVVGEKKLKFLRDLANICSFKVTADHKEVVKNLSLAFAKQKKTLQVLVECDTGGSRCGVQSPQEALELAKQIHQSKGLKFLGLLTYPAANQEKKVDSWLGKAKQLCEKAGLPPKIVSSGGSPSLFKAHLYKQITEYRAGTYIYADRSLLSFGYSLKNCALSVLATVVSTPSSERCILDAGSKSLSSDLLNQKDYGFILEYPKASIRLLSEEHATVDLSKSAKKPVLKERVHIIPNHCCVVSNLFNEVYFYSLDSVAKNLKKLSVDARGKLW